MKKMMFVVAALAGAALWSSSPASADGKCGCPCKITGAETAVTNTDSGVSIVVTAKDPAVVKKIQEAAAKMKDGGCAKCSGKPGCKCEKCAGKHHKEGCDCPKCKAKGKAGKGKDEKAQAKPADKPDAKTESK